MVNIFIKQLEGLFRKKDLVKFDLKQKSLDKNKIELELDFELNKRFLKQKAMSLANLRFKDRKVSSVEVSDDGSLTINFYPKKE